MSLVEVMVAILLLGIILSAAASSLIQFGKTAAQNERRVQSTALMNRLQEELQGVPWQDAAIYEEDLDALLADGLEGLTKDDATGRWEFDGEEVVVLDGPGTGDRRPGVPSATRDLDGAPYDVDGRSYDVVKLVTWSDPVAGVKRFTSIASWTLYDRTYEERFLSERAATSTEAGDPERPRVIQFDVGPSPMLLETVSPLKPAQNSGDIRILVRFSEGVSTAKLQYTAYVWQEVAPVDGEPQYERIAETRAPTLEPKLSDGTGKYLTFEWTIAAGTETFEGGTSEFRVVGDPGAEVESRGITTMSFLGDGSSDPDAPTPGEPVDVNGVGFSPTEVCVDNRGLLTKTVTIDAIVDGLGPENHQVTLDLNNGSETITRSMAPVAPDTFGPVDAKFRVVLAQGENYGWALTGKDSVVVTNALAEASRPSDGDGALGASAWSSNTLRVYPHNSSRCS